MSRLAAAGVVSIPALDLRRRPDHASELTSQLLLGETARILGSARGGEWLRVRSDIDGYAGWARAWGLMAAPAARVARWARLARGVLATPIVRAMVDPGGEAQVAPLHWRSRVISHRTRGAWRQVELPTGARAWVPIEAVAAGARGAAPDPLARVRGLLGAPYLWGGRTALGIDCSALAQLLLAEQGAALPRDARHQYRAARPLSRGAEPAPLDLFFFADRRGRVGHVGVHLGGGFFVQSRGIVRISHIDPDNPMYDNGLDGTYAGCRRILPVAGPRVRRGRGDRAETA
jgi:cell wall-associated NlpC family hydrolase